MNVQTSSLSSINSIKKDSVQRKKEFIRRRRHQADEKGASKVIAVGDLNKIFSLCVFEAMSKMAKDQEMVNEQENQEDNLGLRPPPTWR